VKPLEYLEQRARFGIKLGLRDVRRLLAALGHPERCAPVLLVGGTNGKGSVVAYADAALRGAGLRVGRYTSPHLVRVNERIAVDGRTISTADLETAIARVRRAALRLVAARALPAHPTHFEVLTAAAFLHFRRARVRVMVLEVGLGGRLDATNVTSPLVSAVVSVARDHEVHLGPRLSDIAAEKAGILRRGRTTVVGPLPAAARRVLERVARARGARLLDARAGVRVRRRGGRLDVQTPHGEWSGLRALPGAHQQDNLLVAVRLLEEARRHGLAFAPPAAARGLSAAHWPGRLQWIEGRPPLLLDGAHNPAAARALAAHLRSLPRPLTLLFGAMRDKRIATMARTLFPLARAVVLTAVDVPRAARPEEIARRAGGAAARLVLEPDPVRALARARALTPRGGVLVVAGSLYLVGEVLKSRRRRSGRRVP